MLLTSAKAEFTPFPAHSREAVDVNFRNLDEELRRLDREIQNISTGSAVTTGALSGAGTSSSPLDLAYNDLLCARVSSGTIFCSHNNQFFVGGIAVYTSSFTISWGTTTFAGALRRSTSRMSESGGDSRTHTNLGNDSITAGDWTSITGGYQNNASGDGTHIGGGQSNTAAGESSFVGGGKSNNPASDFNTVCGGQGNSTAGAWSTVAGGRNNSAGSIGQTAPAFVGGGEANGASGQYSAVVGGYSNTLTGGSTGGFIGGGDTNAIAGGSYGSILGGSNGTITNASHAAILGGQSNSVASGNDNSIVAGRFARAFHKGSMVVNMSEAGTTRFSSGTWSITQHADGGIYGTNGVSTTTVIDTYGRFGFPPFTKAAINAMPTPTGKAVMCSDCANPYTICVGTGATAGMWREQGTTTGCY